MNELLASVTDVFKHGNLGLLIGSFIPAALYALLVYFTSPYKSINLKRGFLYMIMGTMSVFFVLAIHTIFPNWRVPISDDFDLSLFFFAFIQVALLEELCKYFSFKLITNVRGETSRESDHPAASLYYSMMVALGFGFAETFHYSLYYGDGVIVVRAFTAILAHMLCGLFIGYFYALGRTNYRLGIHSTIDAVFKKRKMLKRLSFTIFGIFVATFFHGLYDYNLFNMTDSSISIMILILIGGLVGAMAGARHLNRIYRGSK
jgi:RsiW-degrading membrane proteinase PrsW (M82 family)